MSFPESTISDPIPTRRFSLNPFTFLGQISEGRYWAYYLIIPSLLLVALVILYPVISGIGLSFQEMRLTRPAKNGFIGLQHYQDLLTDQIFRTAVLNTLEWVVVGVVSQFLVGLITALALNKGGIVMKAAGVIVLLPWILPSVVAGNIWALMLDSRLGVINDLFVKIGLLDQYKAWFADPNTALPATMLISLWRGFPFFTLLLLAGLQAIDDDLYEASAVDGANRWSQFWHITLPLLRPVIVATVVLRVIGLVNSPDLLLLLTNGGPGYATQVLSLYAFQKAYSDFDFGYSGAISVVMFLILMVFTVIYVRVSRVAQE
ncbi:MAG: sugar ABC transporter permease [Anaerolineae bacterium]|nr:sugar ABC transporter permease [Anaerolineae bacterium]